MFTLKSIRVAADFDRVGERGPQFGQHGGDALGPRAVQHHSFGLLFELGDLARQVSQLVVGFPQLRSFVVEGEGQAVGLGTVLHQSHQQTGLPEGGEGLAEVEVQKVHVEGRLQEEAVHVLCRLLLGEEEVGAVRPEDRGH